MGLEWEVVAGGIGILISTIFLAWRGWEDVRKVQGDSPERAVAGVAQDNAVIRENTEQLRELNRNMHDLSELLRTNTAAIVRSVDIQILRRD